MERFTISLDEKLARQFDELIGELGYQNRSETVRDMLRQRLETERIRKEDAPFCTVALSTSSIPPARRCVGSAAQQHHNRESLPDAL